MVIAAASLALLLAAGCGGGSSIATNSTTPAAQSTSSLPATSQPGNQTTGAGQSSSSGETNSTTESGSSSSGPENSIQTYGSAATPAQKASLAATAFSFFHALAAADYARVCSDLTSANRQQIQAFLKNKSQKAGGCAAVMPTLLHSVGSEARRAAAGRLSTVRVKGDTAFVLFEPKGGKPSYFVLKREGSAWKPISLAPGTPLQIP
jgi:hypothetical protein